MTSVPLSLASPVLTHHESDTFSEPPGGCAECVGFLRSLIRVRTRRENDPSTKPFRARRRTWDGTRGHASNYNFTMQKTEANRPPATNIATVVKLEEQFLKERNAVERLGDAIGAFAGSMSFVVLHVLFFATWFIINSKVIPGVFAFDPYPFILLSMVVSVEAVLLSTFVLMKQNRESKRAEHRQQLTLQIDLLAEQI